MDTAFIDLQIMLVDLDKQGNKSIIMTGKARDGKQKKFVVYQKSGDMIRIIKTSPPYTDSWKDMKRLDWDKNPILFLCGEPLAELHLETRTTSDPEVQGIIRKLPVEQQTNIQE